MEARGYVFIELFFGFVGEIKSRLETFNPSTSPSNHRLLFHASPSKSSPMTIATLSLHPPTECPKALNLAITAMRLGS